MQIKMVPIADIIPYKNNPRKNTDAVQYVKNSIKEFGFRIPMVLDAENVIVCGHTRYLAAQELGITEVPCTYADDLTEEQIKAFRLADNKTAEMSGWNFEKLELELSELPGIDMSDFGFDFQTLDEITGNNERQKDLSESWEVIIECNNEGEQQNLYNRMTEEGWKCRLSTL